MKKYWHAHVRAFSPLLLDFGNAVAAFRFGSTLEAGVDFHQQQIYESELGRAWEVTDVVCRWRGCSSETLRSCQLRLVLVSCSVCGTESREGQGPVRAGSVAGCKCVRMIRFNCVFKRWQTRYALGARTDSRSRVLQMQTRRACAIEESDLVACTHCTHPSIWSMAENLL